MSSPFILETVGVELLAQKFKTDIRLFQKLQRQQMRRAAVIVQRDVVQEVQNLFASRGPHKSKSGATLGPLDRKIGVRVFNSKTDVVGLVRPKASAFYGRFQETGLSVSRKTRNGQSPFHLPARPFLKPVAAADAGKVADIMGDSYEIFA